MVCSEDLRGVIYKSVHEDFSEFRSLLLTAQTRFLSAKIQQSSTPLAECWFRGCFFECMEFISPCTGKNKTFSLTLEFVLLWGLKFDLRIELTSRDFWNPQNPGARYRSPTYECWGTRAISDAWTT